MAKTNKKIKKVVKKVKKVVKAPTKPVLSTAQKALMKREAAFKKGFAALVEDTKLTIQAVINRTETADMAGLKLVDVSKRQEDAS